MKKKIKNSLLALAAVLVLLGGCVEEESNTLKLELSQTANYDFPSVKNENYEAVEPLTVTITNAGNQATGKLTIVVDGSDADAFEVSTTETAITNLDPADTTTFTVAPRTGLLFGDYQATVYVSGRRIPEKKFNIRFVVTELAVDSVNIVTLPDKLTYGVGEPLDLTGLVVTATVDSQVVQLAIKDKYLRYDFSTAGPKKVGISIGSAPVQEFDVTVLNLAERVKAALGSTDTITIYANEIDPLAPTELYTTINVPNTNITLTTPAGSTIERIIKKSTTGYLFNIDGVVAASNVKLILDGYVTLKGCATSDYGGTDLINNNNVLIYLHNFAAMEMKGHSKVTGNVRYGNTVDNILGGAFSIKNYGELILDEYAQVSNNWVVNAGTGIPYGGALCISTGSTVRIKGHAKVTKNTALHLGAGNAYGGAATFEAPAILYMEGGEISNNTAQSTTVTATGGGIAGGGALQIITPGCQFIFSGGVVKDNKLKFITSGRGSAINVGHAKAVIISGSASIPSGSGDITIGTDGKTDIKNAVSLSPDGIGGFIPININGTLSTTSAINVDLQTTTGTVVYTTPILMNYNDGTPIVYTVDAPASKFVLRNLVNYAAGVNTITPLDTKKINADGTIGNK